MNKSTIEKQTKEHFSNLEFEEANHVYTVGTQVLTPTSNMIKDYYEEFPLEKASKTCAKAWGRPQEDILAEWEKKKNDACDLGTEIHDFAEEYVLTGKNLRIANDDLLRNKKLQVVKFWKEIPKYYDCVSVEQRMYSLKYSYAGTTDFLLHDNRDNTVVIGDYKTNKDIFKTYGGMMKKPFHKLKDNPYNHYQLQLSFYQILLEDIGIEVSNRVVVWLKQSSYELYHPEDYTEELRKII